MPKPTSRRADAVPTIPAETTLAASGQAGDEQNGRDYRELLVFCQTQVGFRLGMAEYDIPATRDRVIAQLLTDLSSRGLLAAKLDLASSPDERFLLTRLRGLLESSEVARPDVVLVVNLESTVDYSAHSAGSSEGLATLANANMQRDAFPQVCPCPVMVWLTSFSLSAFARHAPDLWHWRAGSFRFAGRSAEATRFEDRIVSHRPGEADGLPQATKRERVGQLLGLLSRYEESGDRASPGAKARRMAALNELGLIYCSLADPREALDHFRQALELARELGDRGAEGTSLANLGMASAEQRDLPRAIDSYKRSLAILAEVGDRRGRAAVLNGLGNVLLDLGEPRKAIAPHEQALALAREIHDLRAEGAALANLGLAYAHVGEISRATGSYERALQLAVETGDRVQESAVLDHLGLLYAEQHEASRAIECYEQALAIAREIGHRRAEGSVLANMGLAYADLGESSRAIEYYEQALKITRDLNERRGEAAILENLGCAYADSGDLDDAMEYHQQALEIARETHARRYEALASWNLGLAYERLDDLDRAIELMQVLVDYERELGHPDAEKHAGELDRIRRSAVAEGC